MLLYAFPFSNTISLFGLLFARAWDSQAPLAVFNVTKTPAGPNGSIPVGLTHVVMATDVTLDAAATAGASDGGVGIGDFSNTTSPQQMVNMRTSMVVVGNPVSSKRVALDFSRLSRESGAGICNIVT